MSLGTASSAGPLSHLRVLDLTRLYVGAGCTLLLADLGADVLKVEGPGGGDGMRFATGDAFPAAHVAFNRGKRSLQLNLKHERGPEVLGRLMANVDVVIESHRPGALDALGIGYPQMSALHPRLIWCSATGFGQNSPHAQAPGHDVTYLGYSGLLAGLHGSGGARPEIPDYTVGVPLGALTAAIGILAAVAGREQSGKGAWVDISIVDSAMWLISEDIARAANQPGPRWGLSAARMVYRCADGKFVTVAASEAKSWTCLCEALGLSEISELQYAFGGPTTIARLSDVFATKPAAHWISDPGWAGGVGPMNEAADLLDDAHVQARGALAQLRDNGPRVLATPIRMIGADTMRALSAPPALGEHTDEALAQAGFTSAEIALLHSDSVV
jgi:alpha-methylacyl-CoA racemase